MAFLNALGLIAIGAICLILTIVSIVFTIISFANNKSQKYVWLSTFFIGLVGVIVCIFLFVHKATDALHNFSESSFGQYGNYSDSLSTYLDSTTGSIERHQADSSSAQIKLLRSYLPSNMLNKEPEGFYSYLGFRDYYRHPLRYPYSIHCNYTRDNGELFNEVNVTRFEENDNGEIYAGISYINKIAFDKDYLLIEQAVSSTRTDKLIKHYLLYVLDTEKFEEVKTEKELFKLAKQKGYSGADTLMTLEQYFKLF